MFFKNTTPPEIYTLSLHDALPITRRSSRPSAPRRRLRWRWTTVALSSPGERVSRPVGASSSRVCPSEPAARSEEHTSELQSHVNLVCRLLLEKKNTTLRKYRRLRR